MTFDILSNSFFICNIFRLYYFCTTVFEIGQGLQYFIISFFALIGVSAVLISFGALFQSLGASILKLSDATSFLWSSFLEWQPCNSPLMVFYLFRAIYLGFSQCSLWIMPVFLCPISMYYFLLKYCYDVSNHL